MLTIVYIYIYISFKDTNLIQLDRRCCASCRAASTRHCCNTGVSFQNELIIQIMTESHETDSLKRKIEDAKMKLITEIKVQDFL